MNFFFWYLDVFGSEVRSIDFNFNHKLFDSLIEFHLNKMFFLIESHRIINIMCFLFFYYIYLSIFYEIMQNYFCSFSITKLKYKFFFLTINNFNLNLFLMFYIYNI